MRAHRPHRALRAVLLLAAVVWVSVVPGGIADRVLGAEYTFATVATYDVQPDARRIGVTVDVTFTNTTPDPEGQFSVFDEVKLAIHDEATEVAASDAEGAMTVAVAVEDGVNVATVALREPLRFESSVTLTVTYTLPDTEGALRVRPSLVTFPAWSFGTSGEVRVQIPDAFEVHVDGDTLSDRGGELVSGPIEDPSQWLALVTALNEPELTSFEAAVPLAGGTADLEVRAFADDEAWGERTIALAERALPLLEEEIGLPYPGIGELVLTESVALNASGIGEEPSGVASEISIAYDEPPFTTLHQLAHVWLSESLIGARWIREGMASEVAERIAERVEVSLPYDPATAVTERAAAAFPLDSWTADAGVEGEPYGYAASWQVIREIRDRIGVEALRTTLARVAASVGPYHLGEIPPAAPAENGTVPAVPLTTRSFLDHLEAVGKTDLTDIFRARVLTEADVALLEARAAARTQFTELVAAADGWGAPDPVAGAMTAWSFEDASAQMVAATEWLAERDALLAQLSDAGLSAPDRLQQAYRAHGGGADAQAELAAERDVAESYADTADDVNAERSLVERIGLAGGADPSRQLRLANGRFAEGDLSGSVAALREVQQQLASAEAAGIARLASAVLILVVLLAFAVLLFRRRASYTARR